MSTLRSPVKPAPLFMQGKNTSKRRPSDDEVSLLDTSTDKENVKLRIQSLVKCPML